MKPGDFVVYVSLHSTPQLLKITAIDNYIHCGDLKFSKNLYEINENFHWDDLTSPNRIIPLPKSIMLDKICPYCGDNKSISAAQCTRCVKLPKSTQANPITTLNCIVSKLNSGETLRLTQGQLQNLRYATEYLHYHLVIHSIEIKNGIKYFVVSKTSEPPAQEWVNHELFVLLEKNMGLHKQPKIDYVQKFYNSEILRLLTQSH